MTDLRDRIAHVRAEHRSAEVVYGRLLRREPDAVDPVRLAAANARAEGLAEALGILTGLDVVDVRARVRADLERTRQGGLAGAARARKVLEAHRTRFDVV